MISKNRQQKSYDLKKQFLKEIQQNRSTGNNLLKYVGDERKRMNDLNDKSGDINKLEARLDH